MPGIPCTETPTLRSCRTGADRFGTSVHAIRLVDRAAFSFRTTRTATFRAFSCAGERTEPTVWPVLDLGDYVRTGSPFGATRRLRSSGSIVRAQRAFGELELEARRSIVDAASSVGHEAISSPANTKNATRATARDEGRVIG